MIAGAAGRVYRRPLASPALPAPGEVPPVATRKPKSRSHTSAMDTTRAVDEFMARLDHPFKAEIEAVRAAVLGVDDSIAEGIKWNAPSFRKGEYFATVHLRERNGVAVILHLGAKARVLPTGGLGIDDPAGLLKWLGKDRAMVRFANLAEFAARKADFEWVLRQWIDHVS
jgi:hypothetical protein